MPPNAVAHRADIVFRQLLVVLDYEPVMLGRCDQVKPPVVVAPVRGTFEATEKEGIE
jgi:hypothetical protein